MSLRLYNTLGRKLENFTPLDGTHVGLYTCGPTVYNTAHIGNLRTYIFEDVLRRTLELDGYQVKHVMNITDVGHLSGHNDHQDEGADKIEAAAKQQHVSAYAIARQYEREFFDDLKKLNILPPTVVLRATETIDLQIDLIKKLEDKGFTYQIPDGVYFDTSKFPHYGELSGQKTSDKMSGARVEINQDKKNPSDFALWKLSRLGENRQMEWPSPWGVGFPGWHVECSAMSMKELGEQFDLHTGGIDHIPVHHENEIAQSEAATGKHPFVNFWLHGEFLKLPGKRMGKSEGNSITLQEVIDKGIDPLAFRYLCLQTHYRKPLSFTWESLEAAQKGLLHLWEHIVTWSDAPESKPTGVVEKLLERFFSDMNTDLNTSSALSVLNVVRASGDSESEKLQLFAEIDKVLGLQLNPAYARTKVRKNVVVDIDALPNSVQFLVTSRNAARTKKDFPASDRLKKELEALGYSVTDTPTGTQLRKK